jgi:putative FmdB family regulatory protein
VPIYEYQCKKCEHTFEEIQGLNDEPLTTCPECNSKKALTKLLSGTLVQFNGDGWTPKFHN